MGGQPIRLVQCQFSSVQFILIKFKSVLYSVKFNLVQFHSVQFSSIQYNSHFIAQKHDFREPLVSCGMWVFSAHWHFLGKEPGASKNSTQLSLDTFLSSSFLPCLSNFVPLSLFLPLCPSEPSASCQQLEYKQQKPRKGTHPSDDISLSKLAGILLFYSNPFTQGPVSSGFQGNYVHLSGGVIVIEYCPNA